MTPPSDPSLPMEFDPHARIRLAVALAAHLLPAQGPISVFIHHNTLHAFEDLPFDEALRLGAEVFGCEPYLSEGRFRESLGRGRIRFPDLRAVLDDDLGTRASEPIPPRGTRVDLRLAMLQNPHPTGTPEELRWHIEETDALRKVRPGTSAPDLAYLIAETRRWVMRDLRAWDGAAGGVPERVPGLFAKFRETRVETWEEATWEAFSLEALWSVCRAGVISAEGGMRNAESKTAEPLPVRQKATLLALRDWGGMLHESEVLPDRFAVPVPPNCLIGFLAVRLLLERFSLAHAARESLGYERTLKEIRDHLRSQIAPLTPPGIDARALPIFCSLRPSAGLRTSCTNYPPTIGPFSSGKSKRSIRSNDDACSTSPTSGGSANRRWMR